MRVNGVRCFVSFLKQSPSFVPVTVYCIILVYVAMSRLVHVYTTLPYTSPPCEHTMSYYESINPFLIDPVYLLASSLHRVHHPLFASLLLDCLQDNDLYIRRELSLSLFLCAIQAFCVHAIACYACCHVNSRCVQGPLLVSLTIMLYSLTS